MRQMPHSTSIWNVSGQCGRPIKVWCGMISIPILGSKTLTLTPNFFSLQESNAEKKSKQNRSQNRRQRRTRTSPQIHFISQHHLHFHHQYQHLLLLHRPPPPLPPKPHLQIKTHRPLPPLKPTSTMEVEVKLRLKDSFAHRNLTTLLSAFRVRTLNQHNLFFDTPTSSLSSQRAVLRLRFLDKDARCIVSLKAKPTLVDGVSRVEEDEEEVDPKAARECVENPSKLFDLESRVVRRVREEFGVEESGNGLVCLGGFENVREVFEWRGLKLEVDETKYAFGTSYEVECETEDPEAAKTLLEELLNDNGIVYVYSEMTKFAVFRAGRLPH